MNLNKIFNRLNQRVGQIGSNTRFDIYRVDYTAADQTGVLIASNKPARIDTRSQQWAEPSLQGGMYFDMFLDRTIVQPGDVLVPAGLPYDVAYATKEVVTIMDISGIKPCVGMLSDCVGTIADSISIPVYDNIRFQWCSPGTPKPPSINNMDVIPYDRRKCLMYRRQGIGLPTALINGMRLLQTIDGVEYWWTITDIMSVGSTTMLQVEQDQS